MRKSSGLIHVSEYLADALRKMGDENLLDRMRALQADPEPEGWPAVQMRDITALVGMVEALQAELDGAGPTVRVSLDRLRMPEGDDAASEWAMLHGDSAS